MDINILQRFYKAVFRSHGFQTDKTSCENPVGTYPDYGVSEKRRPDIVSCWHCVSQQIVLY